MMRALKLCLLLTCALATNAAAAAVPLKIVDVSAPAINCIFQPSCTITPTDTSAAIPLAGAAGTAFLQTRTFKSAAASPAAGRYGYLYRIDLRNAYGIVNVPCLSAMTLTFGVPSTLDYNTNGIADEQVFVVTKGGIGSVKPTSASRTGSSITFQLGTPVCAGSGPGNGQSTYFFGLSSFNAPVAVTATLKDTSGPTYGVAARAPFQIVIGPFPTPIVTATPPTPTPIATATPTPPPTSGYIPPECGTDPVSSPMLLDCWLQHFPNVANAIDWQLSDGSYAIVMWSQWTPVQKAQLRQAFLDAWVWHQNGMNGFQGPAIGEPPANQENLADDHWLQTVLDEQTQAWPLYLAQVAHSLAAEIGAWVPWTLRNYANDEMFEVLSAWGRYHYTSTSPADPYHSNYPGYVVYASDVTPAHPTYVFPFLKGEGLVGATRAQTIASVVDWSRWHLAHFVGVFSPPNAEYHWQYRGLPPVSRTIEGTELTDPQYSQLIVGPRHWTAGCYGTTDFLRELLRTVNIPVMKRSSLATCGHTMPYFPTEGRYLSHGDDPYNGLSLQLTQVPADELLIDQGTWDQWFTNAPNPCANVGRRPPQLLVQYLSDTLTDKYCADVANGLDHAGGTVYQDLSYHYTVAELEAATLWERLSQRAQQQGKCN